jgi:hypothetical protein
MAAIFKSCVPVFTFCLRRFWNSVAASALKSKMLEEGDVIGIQNPEHSLSVVVGVKFWAIGIEFTAVGFNFL